MISPAGLLLELGINSCVWINKIILLVPGRDALYNIHVQITYCILIKYYELSA